ncbi:MAG TPA: NAD(P)-dependent oxidoreductase [Paracoccaceae bacterium]|nr:NAD(P)-dependent oxidoreductase [Paracoccaceae bacterium]
MRTLVTGSAGHLGEALMQSLAAAGVPAVGLDLKPSAWTSLVGSITDRGAVRQALEGVGRVIHCATLHKPHVATHAMEAFVEVNIRGTLILLEEAVAAGVSAFVFSSSTSVFGDALTPGPGEPAVWITEEVRPVPKNIYGVTKAAAEDLCELFARKSGLPAIVLRIARFFPEADDLPERRDAFADANLKANEFLYRRADIADIVSAHLIAAEKAPELGFDRFVISATTPFTPADLAGLAADAPAVLWRRVPEAQEIYRRLGWRMLPHLDRVYSNASARERLGWAPEVDFRAVLARAAVGEPVLGPLAERIGIKGYHDRTFRDGAYPVDL